MNWRCIAVMPAYNEAECIEMVCREWLARLVEIDGALLVVDDGSRDGTGRILDRLADGESRLIVVHQANAGHGAALVNGYRLALGLAPEYVFQVDADGEMPAALFPGIWEMRGRAGFVIGFRTGRGAHPLRLALSSVHKMLLRALFGVSVRDPNIPFRLMRSACLQWLLESVPEDVFAPNVMLALLAAKAGALASGPEIPVSRRAGGLSTIRGWRTLRLGLRCVGELVRFRMNPWRTFQPGG